MLYTFGYPVEWCWIMVNDVGWRGTEVGCHDTLNLTMMDVVERECGICLPGAIHELQLDLHKANLLTTFRNLLIYRHEK